MRVPPGGYIPGEAPGAYPNDTRIVKVRSEDGDGTEVGTKGTVISSIYAGDIDPPEGTPKVTYFYFVLWDDFPLPVGICDWKIGKEVVPSI